MKALLLLAALLVTIGALIPSVGSGVQAQGAGVCPDNPSPPDAADPSVIVDTPEEGDRVTSPVTISGRARVFEATVSITIFDADGNPIVETFTNAAEAGPTLAPYSAAVPFTVSAEQKGCIRVFEESADDGSPENVVQVEVTLVPATTPPKTGSAGLQGGSDADSHVAFYVAGGLALLGATGLALKRRMWS
jgi:immunoglobulin-like protein involved in spore germination